MTLSVSDLGRLEAATRTLLSPLAAPDVDGWRDAAMGALAEALGAETATFVLPGQPEPVAMYGKDAAAASRVRHFVGPAWTGAGDGPVPLLDEFHRLAVAKRLEVWDMHSADKVLGGGGAFFRNPYADEVLWPERMIDTNSLFVPQARGTAHLALHTFRRKPEPGEHLPLLGVLLPSFKAGLDTLARFGAQRAALDAVAEPLAVFSPNGAELYRNAALAALLAADPERLRIEAHVEAVGRAAARPSGPLVGGPLAAEAAVATARGRYTLRASTLPPGLFGPDPVAMVSVVADVAPALPDAATVRARLGLTRREAEVALLVAEGLTNAGVAERLFVSPHTARHHVENVLAKLDLSSRAAVAGRLMQPV